MRQRRRVPMCRNEKVGEREREREFAKIAREGQHDAEKRETQIARTRRDKRERRRCE